MDSFYGDYLYQNIVPQNHFLRQLRELVPWQRFTYRLLKYYRGKGQVGRPPIDLAIVLKMLLLSYLYNLSERQVEELCNYYLPAKYFRAGHRRAGARSRDADGVQGADPGKRQAASVRTDGGYLRPLIQADLAQGAVAHCPCSGSRVR